jgi:hypothetical protein
MGLKKREKINWLTNRIAGLKKIRNPDSEPELQTLERQLNTILDLDMRRELEGFRQYDILHTEKMTPRFLSLCKNTNNTASLDQIRDDNGELFTSEASRDQHIRDFYRKIYSPDPGMRPLDDNCIEQFLGPEVANNNIVLNAKLSEPEKNFFDRPLTIQELDTALNNMNPNSAGGLDGIPTKFLKKFWAFIRVPLVNYANFSFAQGRLTQSFNSAGIKLIPKKGDISKIKNWRPISLLNNIFKIIAKAIDARLQSLNQIILSRGQKGFTSKRILQECIINITESIAFAEEEKIPAFILALDMAKAFDTVRHDYMLHVYKFFGLGPNLIKMLNTISTGRTACIIKDNGLTTPTFSLGTGFPQGSPPSPNQFNFGEQLLIFKIELDPRIKPIKITSQINVPYLAPAPVHWIPEVRDPGPVPVPLPLPVPATRPEERIYGFSESRRNTEKTEAFADDNNILGLLDQIALQSIKEILSNFADLSGLKCNVDKSQILVVGTDAVPGYVTDTGFAVSDELKILGFRITKNFDSMVDNLDPAIDKIRNLARYWDRFKLSLPGRLSVAKSLMLSQIGFFASILPVPDPVINTIQKAINDFVTGTLKIEKNRICMEPKCGGIGMISVKNYIHSLHCSWIKRTKAAVIDNWRLDMSELSGGDPILINPDKISKIHHPVLHNLAVSFWDFKKKFFSTGKNFFKAPIKGNPLLVKNKRDKSYWDPEIFFGPEISNDIIINDFTADGINIRDRNIISNIVGRNISVAEYNELKTALVDSWSLTKKFTTDELGLSLTDFLKRFKKGSKPFRKIFDRFDASPMVKKQNRRVKTFFDLIDLPIPELNFLEAQLKLWSYNFYPVAIREFILKFRFNILGLNTRVAHFNANIARACTFCSIQGAERRGGGARPPVPVPIPVPVPAQAAQRAPVILQNDQNIPDESFVHLFFDCPITKKVLKKFNEKFLQLDNDILLKDFIFTGRIPNMNKPSLFLMTVASYVCYFIWQCKLQKKTPSVEGLYNDLFFGVENVARVNMQIRLDMNYNLPLCRSWRHEADRRR